MRSHRYRWVAWLGLVGTTVLVALVAASAVIDVPPRSLAPYIEHRLSDHGPWSVAVGRWVGGVLQHLDRGPVAFRNRSALRIGARSDAAASEGSPGSRIVPVALPDDVRRAIAAARPGDVITLQPGLYDLGTAAIAAATAGRADAPIEVRAELPGSVAIEFRGEEGFVVSAPHWRFENLHIRGACDPSGACEHAFHVVGGATHFVARNNTILDFNAQFKVNGTAGRFPDFGVIEGNTLRNSGPRETESPVTPVDIVAASHWTVTGNLIADFVKARADRISYGAFAKGGGTGNRFERNVVICEDTLLGAPGWRVGLSLGGGGGRSARDFCRDRACVVEQDEGVIEANLVASCSDDGIYVNRGARSHVSRNTLLDTGGIVIRFAESSAEVEANLVDSSIRSRDGGLVHAGDNLQTRTSRLYLGQHPHRELFRDAATLDLQWAAAPPRIERVGGSAAPDLCLPKGSPRMVYGAFEDFAACLRSPAPASPP